MDELAQMMRRLREARPERLAGRRVLSVIDYLAGALGLPASDVVGLELEGGTRVVVRPSGTEPKLKIYFEVVVPVAGSLHDARAAARARLAELRAVLGAATGL